MQVHAAGDEGCNLIRQHLELVREIMLAVWQSLASSLWAARDVCYSAAMDLREKTFAGLQLQHPAGHLSVHKLCLKPVGKREKRRKDRAGCDCSDLLSRDTQRKSFSSRRGRRQSAVDAPCPGGERGKVAAGIIMSTMPVSSRESNIRRRHLEGRCRRLSFGRWVVE